MNHAKPIFLKDLEKETNIQAGFVTTITLENVLDTIIFVTARNYYRLYVNGKFVCHGPARTTDGFLKFDEINIKKDLHVGKNIIAFEVSSYGNPFNSYSNDVVLGDGLLMAEIISGDNVIGTSKENFQGIRLSERNQYSERISHCREMTENYSLDEKYFAWRENPDICEAEISELSQDFELLPRNLPLPTFLKHKTTSLVEFGVSKIDTTINPEDPWFTAFIPNYKTLAERPLNNYIKTREMRLPEYAAVIEKNGVVRTLGLKKEDNFYAHYDFGEPLMGFIGINFVAENDGILDMVHLESYCFFDEKDEVSGGANPVTRIRFKKGETKFLTFEPGLLRYLKLYFTGCGNVIIKKIYVTEFCYPEVGGGSFQCSDDDVNRLYNASRKTLQLNSLDEFMDCPERERGGWLCDSYWTGRAARMHWGDTALEKEFIENFLRTDKNKMWKGFFPECYPSAKPNYEDSTGLTTWSYWLMEELCDFVKRSGDVAFAKQYQDRVNAFVEGSLTMVGETGLLENLPNLFVDWSFSNDGVFNRPISTAVNALYAKMLIDLGDLYNELSWKEKGLSIRKIMTDVLVPDEKAEKNLDYVPDSFDIRDGKLVPKNMYSEACQYLTVWSGLFDGKNVEKLIFNIVNTMGFSPKYPPMARMGRAGLFIGLQYRFDLLSKLNEYEILFNELKTLYGMQLREGPGTLWESPEIINTSRCHGFNSYAGLQLMTDVLGLGVPDEISKTIKIAPHPLGLRWARGCVKTKDGLISLSWVNKNGTPEIRLSLPKGWKAV